MTRPELAKVLLTGVVLGISAALVVWFLERFETERLAERFQAMLRDHDAYRAWLEDHGRADS